MKPMIEVTSLNFSYETIPLLLDCTFSIPAGKLTALIGKSGSGKTTLLKLMSSLLQPDSGEIIVDGTSLVSLTSRQKSDFRAEKTGFVFQDFSLLEDYTLLENLTLVSSLQNNPVNPKRLNELLERLSLTCLKDKLPCQVSGGEKQRTALARALLMEPAVIFADEPTGNLDRLSGQNVFSLLKECSRIYGQTIVMVTHDLELAKQCDVILELKDGKVLPYGVT